MPHGYSTTNTNSVRAIQNRVKNGLSMRERKGRGDGETASFIEAQKQTSADASPYECLVRQRNSFNISKIIIANQKMRCPVHCGNVASVRDYYGGAFIQANKSVVVVVQCPKCCVKGEVSIDELMDPNLTVERLGERVIDYLRGKKYELGDRF